MQDRERLGREFPQGEGEDRGPARHGRSASTPFIDLAGADAGKPGKAGLADVRLAQKGGKP